MSDTLKPSDIVHNARYGRGIILRFCSDAPLALDMAATATRRQSSATFGRPQQHLDGVVTWQAPSRKRKATPCQRAET